MYKDKGFSYRSNINLHSSNRDQVIDKDLRSMASNIFDNRVKSSNQLQRFYMPLMKKAFEDSKSTNPSLKSPEQLIFSSRLFEMKETEDKYQIDILKKQIETKNTSIFNLETRVKVLEKNLLVYEPSGVMDNRFQQPYKSVKRMQSYLHIKNDESLFRAKMRTTSLFQQFNVPNAEIQMLNVKTSESQILDHVLNRLKPLASEYRSLINGSFQKRNQLQNEYIKLEYETKQLKESLQLMRNAERNLRQQLEHVKDNWNNANHRIVHLQREQQQKDTEIYRLKKLLDQKNDNINNISKQTNDKIIIQTHLRKQNQAQANDFSLMLKAANVEILELRKKLDQKQFEYNELRVAYQYKIQELDKTNRMNVILKARYEPFDKKITGEYYPKTIYETDFPNLRYSKVISLEDNNNIVKRSQYPTTQHRENQYSLGNEFIGRNNKNRFQRVLELKKGIEEKELDLLRIQLKQVMVSKQSTPQAEKTKHELEILRDQLARLENDLPTRGRN